MKRNNSNKCKIHKFSGSALLLTTLLLTAVTLALSADERKVETIDATATGTSTQLGQIVNVKVTIYEYSTDEDRQIRPQQDLEISTLAVVRIGTW
jgi:hypothetical protein